MPKISQLVPDALPLTGDELVPVVQSGTTVQTTVTDMGKAGYLAGSATYDPPSLGDGVGASTTVTVTGAVLGDFVEGVSFSLSTQGITVTAAVTAADTVTVRFQNETGGVIDLGSGTLRARVRQLSAS